MSDAIIGRATELDSVHAFLDRVPERPTTLVLEGAVGIGKSTIWLAGVEAARERGLCVLVSRPAELERGLAHAGLGDLFDNVLERVLPELSPPRRRALEVALLLEDASRGSDPRTLGVAVRSALEALAAETPVVLAVDDVQWLDPSSASVLTFALRRMGEQPVHVLLARRTGEGAAPSELESAFETDRIKRLPVGPLSLGALHTLFQARLGRTFSRPSLLRVHETSGGNPFYALELARALGADVDPTQPLPVPETLEGLVRARLVELPPATRESLLLAVAAGRPSAELFASLDVTERVLDPALAARVIERTDGTIRFTHPLLASVVYQGVSADERRRAHGRLALVVADPLDRARHLALSTESPDTQIAAVLEDAAAVASTRGAPIATAELTEHALRLTPPSAHSDRHRRALAAARAQRSAGEWTRARSVLADLLAETRAGSVRAEALVLLAGLESERNSVPLLQEALREAASRPALQSVIHCRLAWVSPKPGFDHACIALELADGLDDDLLRGQARAMQAILGWFAGEAEAPEDLPVRVRDFPSAVGGELLVREATLAVVNTLAPFPKREDARALLEREYQEWRERDEPRSSRALWGLAWVEFWAGRWDVAAEYAARARDISIQYGLEMPQDHLPSAVIAVHRGQPTWPESTRNEVSTSLTSSSADTPCSSWRSLDSSLGGAEIRPRPRNGSRRPIGGPRSSGGASRVSAGGAATRSSFCSSSAGSRTRFDSSTSGRRTPLASPASGCWRTRPDAVVSSLPQRGTSRAPVPSLAGRLRSTRRSETPSARLVHCSGSASSGGGHGRSGTLARRSRPHSTDSKSSGQRLGSRRLAASSDESAVAGARRG